MLDRRFRRIPDLPCPELADSAVTRLARLLPGGEKGAGAGRPDKRDAPHAGKSRARSRLRGRMYRLLGSAMVVIGGAGYQAVLNYLEGHASNWLGTVFSTGTAVFLNIVSAVLVMGGISVSLRGRRHLAPIIALTPDAAERFRPLPALFR